MNDADIANYPGSPVSARPVSRRRLTLLDGLILIAALAPGILGSRVVYEEEMVNAKQYGLGQPVLLVATGATRIVAVATPCLGTLNLNTVQRSMMID